MKSAATPSVRASSHRLLYALGVLPAIGLIPAAQASNSTWNLDAAGNFSASLNWTAGVPGAASGTTSADIATFDRAPLLTASRNVTFDAARNLGGVTFDNDSAVAGRVFTLSAATLGGVTPVLSLSPNATIQNIGSGSSVTGANTIDVGMLLNGNTTFSNTYGTSVINIGMTSGASANSITTATDLGAIDLTLTGTSTAGNLLSLRLNQASGTTLRLVKEGTGFWQLNGPTATSSNMTGGLLIRQGGVSIGRTSTLPIGSGSIVVGDNTTTAGDLRISTGSGVTVSNAITVAGSNATNVFFERGGGGGAATFSSNITLARDLVLRQGTSANQALNLNSASSVTGTGNLIINTVVAGGSAGAINLQGGINMTGLLINQSTTGNGTVTVSGLLGSNVTEIIQNSTTSTMAISNGNSTYGATTVSAGTLSATGSGRLGTGDITVASGATLTLANSAAIQDSSAMFFGSTSLINLNFSGADTLSMLAINALAPTYITPGTYTASQLNTFFGGSVFAGTGSLNVLSSIPEPSSFAALAGLGILGFAATRRRNRG